MDSTGVDGLGLSGGKDARRGRCQLSPRRSLRRGLIMTTQEELGPTSVEPKAKTGPNWGRVIALLVWLGFLGLFAAVARTDVDPRVANPNVEGRPRPVGFLTGFD